jgi:hypothetical protein
VSTAETRKRKASESTEEPTGKTICTTAAVMQYEGEQEVPLWQQDSEEEDF